MNPDIIKWLQVENTTRCNAWCPGCARNKDGFGLVPDLKIVDLDLRRFEEILSTLPALDTIQFCGTYGDVMATKMALDHIQMAMQFARRIQIHTHGGFYKSSWWHELAKILSGKDHDIWFALDGIGPVHEIYRQGTSFDKAIKNAIAFIENGGIATWQFIPWKHNEHQISDCIKMSQKLGFKKFKLVKNVRTNFQARNWKTGEFISIEPWSTNDRFNQREIKFVKSHVELENCMHVSLPSAYLNADGKLSVCCEYNVFDQYDQISQFPDIAKELQSIPKKTCLHACGSHIQ